MKTLTKAVLGCAGVLGAWSLLLRPRQGQPGWEELEGVRFAHRGLHDPGLGIPENSMAAFRRALEHGRPSPCSGRCWSCSKGKRL